MKKLFVYLIALSVLLPTAMVAANSTPQKPPKITRPSKPTSKPNVKPRTPAKPTPKPTLKPQTRATWNQSTNTLNVNGISYRMIPVQGGTFQMGSNDGEDDEKPVHNVTLSSYYIGQTEVTQALWKAVMGSNPSHFKGDLQRPVENVSWEDCQKFIQKINRLTGLQFRLPTEAEWEYAARGGNKSRGYLYSGSNNLDVVAWYDKNSGLKPHPVGTKSPNELGLYDMSGNVYESCQDWYDGYSYNSQTNPTGPSSGTHHVSRGGGWAHGFWGSRVSYRSFSDPKEPSSGCGLRLAL